MNISPDLDFDDEYDDDTVRCYESIDENGYFYELYVLIDGEKAAIVITDEGVSICWISCKATMTNITPNLLFPSQESLSWDNILVILEILEKTGCEGKTHSVQEMNDLYERYKKEMGSED